MQNAIIGIVVLIIALIIWIFGAIFGDGKLGANEIFGGVDVEKGECAIEVPFSRKLGPETRKLAYRRRRDDYKYTLHIGQRKLLLSEIEFLTAIGKSGKHIVYAGSANGTHIMLLAGKLFPQFEYHLYDPAPFDPGLSKFANVNIHNEYFTDETCEKWAGRDDVLFISDIRRVPDGDFMTDPKAKDRFEEIIAEDMQWQMNWVKEIKPEWSMLKFRLPYRAGKTEYLDGDLYFQVWPGETSTETRLWVKKGAGTKIYDHTEYESALFRHNVCTRMQYFSLDPITKDSILQFPGLEFDYDSRAEIHILSEYLRLLGQEPTVENLLNLYNEINKIVKAPLINSHGLLPLEPMNERKKAKLRKLVPMEKKIHDIKMKHKSLAKKRAREVEKKIKF